MPNGWYLVAEAGGATPVVLGVIGIDTSAYCHAGSDNTAAEDDDIAEWLADLIAGSEGMSASHCQARCADCGQRWYAEGGLWQFSLDAAGNDVAWEFGDADGFDDAGTIACPDCRTGRVGFCFY